MLPWQAHSGEFVNFIVRPHIHMGDLCKESNVGAWFEEKCINVNFDELSVYDLWQNEGKNYFGWASMFAGKWVIM